MLMSFATVISTVSGVESLQTPVEMMGTLRRAALSIEPVLNVTW